MATLPKFTEFTLGRASKFNAMVDAVQTNLDNIEDAALTPANAEEIKNLYESNVNTNGLTDAEKADIPQISGLISDTSTLQTDVGNLETDSSQVSLDLTDVDTRVGVLEAENLPSRVSDLETIFNFVASPGDNSDYQGRTSGISFRGSNFDPVAPGEYVTLNKLVGVPSLSATLTLSDTVDVLINAHVYFVAELGGVSPIDEGFWHMRIKRTSTSDPLFFEYIDAVSGFGENFDHWEVGDNKRFISFSLVDIGVIAGEWKYELEMAVGDLSQVSPPGSWSVGLKEVAPYDKNIGLFVRALPL